MAADGSRGPKPYQQRHASTLFLRVPASEFSAVIAGRKTEFRASGRATQLDRVETPTPVVAYKKDRRGHQAKLMVLEATWQEPLGAISPESLEREGQPDLAHFRRYWLQRTRRHFAPLTTVCVYQVRPFDFSTERTPIADESRFGALLFDRLYGEWVE